MLARCRIESFYKTSTGHDVLLSVTLFISKVTSFNLNARSPPIRLDAFVFTTKNSSCAYLLFDPTRLIIVPKAWKYVSLTIQFKNLWTNGKICVKVAFPTYTESVKFSSQSLKAA